MEWFGDQERRLRSLPGQETFRISGDENHWYFERTQHFIDCIKTRAAIGKLNVRENNSGSLCLCERDGFGMCARDTKHPVAKTFYKSFQIQCDECFIFNDQDISCDFGRKFATGFLDKFAQCRCIEIQNLCRIILGQPFEGDQEKGLTRLRRNWDK